MHEAVQNGNTAVVTGGASGIGMAAARRFLELGLKVCIADLPGPDLDRAHQALSAAGHVIAVPTDVSNVDQLKGLKAQVLSEFGPVDVLMNNAGIQPGSSIYDAEGTWQRIINVNLL